MDAFDNPARNGIAGLPREGALGDPASQAAPDGDFLAAAAHVTAAASALPLAIQAILVPDASGRIVLPAGASIDDISVSGADLIVTLPNGQVLIIPNGAVDIPSIVIDGDTVPASTVAQLLDNLGELNPEAGVRSSGGNFADPEGPIQDAYALGDLLPYTELAFSQPEDRELLPAIPDDEPEVVIVTPDQPAGAAAATASVDEAGLPVREDEPAGSDSGANSETTTGSIVYDAADGLAAITINGTAITAVGQVIATPLGQLTITSLTPGQVGYSYTLADNSDANADPADVFTVTVTDRDGDTATATLTIDVIDDVPTARADSDAVAAGSFAPETGNVLTGAGTTSGAAGADTPGADGAALTGIRGADGEGGFAAPGTVQGQYGALTIGADGGYTYVRDPGTPGGVDDVFTYQITDGDGDTSTATLTIRIADAPTVITFVPGEGDDGTIVYEADLPGRDGETPGSAFGGGGGGGASTSGTITFTAVDGVGSVAIGGTTLNPGALPQTIASDATGTLVVTGYSFDPATGEGSVTYVYTLIDNTLDGDGTTVSFDLIITDADGDAASDTLDIMIVDDAPTARAESDSVTEDGPTVADGNVLTGLGGGDANATDGVADTQGADGAAVTGVAGGSVGEPLAGAYGSLTLNADGSYSYVLDNAAQPVQGLAAGEVLTETFTYTITDGDGDTSATTLTITINGTDDGVTVDGLDADGAELTVDEDDLADGSSPDAAALTQDGSFSVSTPDGLGNVSVGGVQVVTNGVFTPGTVTSPLGTVNITGFTPVTGADGSVVGGTFTYEYVLADNTLTHGSDGEDSVTDSFAVLVTDSDGSSANASLDVRIIDDVPTARDDSDRVTEDGPATADGNVLTGLGGGDANATDGVADTQGADGASVTAVSGGTVGAAFATAYGTLTLNGDGSYSYLLDNAAQAVQGLSAGETLTDSVTYTITDGDGDTATATLTITINGADDGVTIEGLDAGGAELSVDEDDLPARAGEAPGSDATPDGVTDSDSFTVSTPDGMGSVILDSFNGVPLGAPLTLVTADGGFTPQSVATAYGTLAVTGFTPVTGADGSVIGGSFTYTYTLNDNRTDHPAAGQDDRTDNVGVTVTDADGSSASAAIDIRITDDVPDAIDDGATQTIENAPVTIDVLANDVQGADSVQPSAVALVAGSLTGSGTLVNNGDGSFTYTPGAQESGTISFQYRITDGDGDSDVATATITLVADSAPRIGKAADVTVDEDGLAGANIDNGLAGEVTSTGSASATGTITVDFGSDVPGALAGSLVLNDSAALDTQLTVGGVPVTFAKDGDDLVGSVGGNEVIRIALTSVAAGPGANDVTYGYSVTLSQAVDQALPGVEDSDLLAGIGFTVTDSDGTQSSGSFGVTIIDDLPTLNLSDAPTSVVEGATVNGSWTLDAGADGVASVNVSFGSGSATLSLTPGSSVSITQPTGTLTVGANGSFSFAAAGDQDDAANPAASFTLSAVDRDGDPTQDSLTIAITDGAKPMDAAPITLTVNEAAIDGIGSNPASGAEVASGDLSFTAGSDTLSGFAFTGVAGLAANLDGAGTDIFWSMAPGGQTITGSLTLGGAAAITIALAAPATIAPGATASASVTVTLADNLPHALANAAQTQALGNVTVQATDTDGDVATGTVTVRVTDDIPTAEPDIDSVAEDGALIADGNVLTGGGGTDANGTDGAADTPGADGAVVTALVGGTVGAPLVSVYGTLTLNADGSYSYALDNANSAVQGLSAGQTLTETFTYTITDGDGDPATTTLTITIKGANDKVTINGLAVPGGEETVNEDDLPDGSSPNPAALTQTGDFTVDAPDGLNNVTIGTAQVMTNGVFTPGLTTTSPLGTVTITGFTPVLASDGSVIGGTFTYQYVLDDNTLTHLAAGEDDVTDSFAVTVTDSDGSVGNASLDVRVIDDVPAASAEANQNVAEGATVIGSLDFVEGADGASVTHINGTVLVFGGDGFSQGIDIGDGTIKVKADGSYSFTADAAVPGTGSASATYTVTDGDNDTATAAINFTITDANAPNAGETKASVDDDALAGGNPASMTGDLADPNSDGDNDQATFGGLLNLDFGGDGAGSVNFAAMDGLFVNVGQESVQLSWNAGTNTLTATGPRGALFTVELTNPATGAYQVTLLDNVLHTPGGDENDASVVLGFTVIDSDGSTAPGTLRIAFDDDAPTVVAGTVQPMLTVDESNFAGDDGASFASVFTPAFGADGAAAANSVTYALGIGAGATGLVDSATNEAVVLVLNGNIVEGRTATTNALVFTVGVAANGTVTLDQSRAVMHTPNSGPDQPAGLSADNLVTLTATVTDGDGDTATATANIGQNLVFKDDAPVANDDSAGLTEGGPASVTFDVDTNDNAGADGFGSRSFTSLTGAYGTITVNLDGTQTYTLTPAGQAAIDALAPGATLTDIFTYTLIDKDGDSDPATLTVTLTGADDGVTITNLTPKLGGGDAMVDEDDLPAGSDTTKESLTTTGSFNISAPDGVANLSVHGVQLINNGVFTPAAIPTPFGNMLNITAYNAATGEVSYSYTLNAAETHPGIQGENSLFEDFTVELTDTDGDDTDSLLSIAIVDDVPTARPDTDAISEDAPGGATGNVITGIGTTNAPGSADTAGADGAAVTGVAAGTSATAVAGNVGAALGGSYGALTLNAGGGYTYTLNNGNAAVQALGVGETLTETFTYTITDGDGDQSTTTLTITINGANDLPTIGTAATAVSDEGLAGGFPDGVGTVDTTNLTLRTGTIAVGDPDGDPLTLSLGAPATALFSGGQPIVWDTTNPQLLLGKVGAETIISVAIDNGGNYTVSLLGPIDHPDTTLEDALSLVVPVSANDGTTTVTNAAALTIGLEDDAPAAIAPLAAALINAPGASVYRSLDSDGDVDNNYGGDGPGSVIFTAATIAALQSQNLTAGGQALNYVISAGGTVLTAEKPNGDDVFIIRLQPAGHADQYQVEMVQKLDSTATIDFNSGGYNIVGGNTAWIGFAKAGDNNSPDILVTPMTNGVDGGKMNANATSTGVSDGNSVGATEAVRIDFVVDLTGTPGNNDYAPLVNQTHAFDSHYSANGASALFTNINSSSSVRIVARDDLDTDNDVGDGVKDSITGVAISFNGATLIVTAAGVYNVGGQNYTASFSGGEATVAGVVEGTRLAGFTADGYNSIEFHHAGGDTFKIGDFGAVVQTENPVTFNVPVTIVDGDGDTAPGSLAITTAPPLLVVGSATGDVAGEATDHVVANPQGQPDGTIEGGAFDDTLVGDPGSVTITEGQQANIVLVLDSSGSMTTQIDFGNGTISRMQALKNGVNALIDSLSQSGAKDVRITVIDFDSDGDNLGTFDLIVNGVVQAGEVDDAKDAVNGMTASGSTNYEDGLQDALSWINGGNGIAGADVNKVVFVSDGNPTVWNSGGNGSDTDATNVQNSMNQVLGSDGTNEPQQILATGYSIDSVGVNVNSPLLARLSDVEDGIASGGTGSATNATSAEELAAVLQVLGGSTDLAAAGNDTINGGQGADVIFGDVLYTDTLAANLGVNLAPGSGWAVFQTLEGRVNAESIDPAGNGADWNRQDTIAYIRANYTELAQESGRTGGNDIINAGGGNDVILGQEGNDTISAGGGDDLIAGGTGRDLMTGGAGSDSFVFNAGESRPTLGGSGNAGTITGHDVITDFDLATDILNLPGTPVADGDGEVNGTNSGLTIGGEPVRSHSVTNGVISFDDNNDFTTALALSSDARVAAAVDYLQRNDLGPAGTTVAFVAGTRTFVYQQVGADPDPAADILVELQGVAITNLTTLIGTRVAPVTLDLDGDGLDFVSSAAGAAFDHDGDGVREATSWAGRGDGILVRDANGDGIANDGGEISFAVADSTDLEGLRLQYDSNGDGQLSAADAEFASFGVWQDANGDGVTGAGEFRSLADLGIASIALTSDGKAYVAGDGEVIVHGEASFTRTDGSTAAVGDVSFITPRAANDIDRTAGNQALAGSLVAAALVAIAHEVRPDGPVTDRLLPEQAAAIDVADGGEVAVTAEIARTAAPHIADETAPDRTEEARSAPSTTTHDEADPASIDADRGDWRTDAGNDAGPDDNADALFDQVANHAALAQGLMDGLLALAALPAEAGVADAAAHDPAATAVLAEVLEGANAIDQLIDAVAGAGTAQEAAEAPVFDLAQFLDQRVISEAAIVPHPTIEQELHQLATA